MHGYCRGCPQNRTDCHHYSESSITAGKTMLLKIAHTLGAGHGEVSLELTGNFLTVVFQC